MSGTPETQIEKADGEGLAELKSKWGWLLAWGIITIMAGWFMLGHVVLASVAAAMIIGIAILVAGVGQIVQAFHVAKSGRRVLGRARLGSRHSHCGSHPGIQPGPRGGNPDFHRLGIPAGRRRVETDCRLQAQSRG